MNPDHMRLLRRARGLDRSGDHPGAAKAYQMFLDKEPQHADAWSDYAGHLLALGRFEDARAACETTLRLSPGHSSASLHLGFALMRQGRLREAEHPFGAVLESEPHRLDGRLGLMECLLRRGDLDGVWKVAGEHDRTGVAVGNPARLELRHAELWAIFGLALLEVQRFKEAKEASERSLLTNPRNLMAQATLGSIQMAQGHLIEAEGAFRKLLLEHPRDINARLLLIVCLTRRLEVDLADQEIARVIRDEPDSYLVHSCVGGIYTALGRWAEYRMESERFHGLNPTSALAEYEQSFVDLLFGDMARGWEGYEARLRVPNEIKPQRAFAQPAWRGEAFARKTLLLWCEQGFGDTLMFVRYLPLVKALGGRVLLEVQPSLLAVAATCGGADEVIPRGASLPQHDLQASLLSLPFLLRTELASIPAEIPYLDVPAVVPHRQAIQEALASAKESTRIGLVWAGSPGHKRDLERSLPPSALGPLAALSGVTWFSFQLGARELPPLPELVSLAPLLLDFSDTAYALSGMDLVITVDTSVAHLAGALGIPTLLLLTFQPDFRWLLGREDSPWYPSLHLYRQPSYGDWKSVIRKVVADLTQGP